MKNVKEVPKPKYMLQQNITNSFNVKAFLRNLAKTIQVKAVLFTDHAPTLRVFVGDKDLFQIRLKTEGSDKPNLSYSSIQNRQSQIENHSSSSQCQNAPKASEHASVAVFGESKAIAGGTVSINDQLRVLSGGWVVADCSVADLHVSRPHDGA